MKGKRWLLTAMVCVFFLAGILLFLWEQGVIVADHSAEPTAYGLYLIPEEYHGVLEA